MSVEVRTRPAAAIAADPGVIGSVAVTAAAGVGLHTFGTVDPMHQMLSDTISTTAGAILLGVACAGLVAAAGFLAAAARHTPRPGVVRALLGLWAASLVAVVVFPTNLPGTELTMSGIIHRYGAAVAVAVPPLVALLVARTRRLRTAALVTGGMAAVYGVAHIPAIFAGAEVLPYAGLCERVLLAMVLLVVVLTSSDLKKRSWT
ncbi:hypothetical protein Aple_098790 [Acrocarpospora pleiomorpha]|uniref:DUF998 domain-containing protein n=1 Tax=Acrocarpospora pleiomorpha TaxID=90975 RepID=A0A5M3Y149_9ACTN|nr:DUF998 domain-containing protein [Acrocarpospora pleiomorpha]GES26980.1 hypothetical protein Aple_098790 [Acrocarpospora pleiomorpha]